MSAEATPLIVAAAQDAGGCNALVPVLHALREQGLGVTIWADGPAASIFAREGLCAQRLSAASARSALPEAWAVHPPALVLVGNSYGGSLEDVFVARARERGIPSVGLLDSWLLYEGKFCDADDRWAFLPDTLIVMDEHARREMADLGAPAERLLALGQPQFDRLDERRSGFTRERRRAARELVGARETGLLVLFFSQDMANFYGGETAARGAIGFTEYDVVACLREALQQISASRGVAIHAAIKLHPREDAGKYLDVADTFTVVPDADPYDLALSADVVVGMDTILLVEAGLLGCATLSVQLHRRGIDTLITNRLGLGRSCYDPRDVRPELERLLFDAGARQAAIESMQRFPVRPGATRRVADWIAGRLLESRA